MIAMRAKVKFMRNFTSVRWVEKVGCVFIGGILMMGIVSCSSDEAAYKGDLANQKIKELSNRSIQGQQFEGTEVINQVEATVGNKSITTMDLQNEIDYFEHRKSIQKDKRNIKSQILDLLISRAIVDQISLEESILVTDKKVDEFINKELENRNITKEAYQKEIKGNFGLSWDDYRKELKRQFQTQQVIQLKVSVPQPTPQEIEDWYKLNKQKLGKTYYVRVILRKFQPGNSKSEIEANKKLEEARKMAARDFGKAATTYSQHPSASRGGLLGWQRLDEVAQWDRTLAGVIQNTAKGTLSPAFKGAAGYYLVKVENVKDIPIDEVYSFIRMHLYQTNEQKAFYEWIQMQKKRIAVRIFLEKYEESTG